MTLVAYKKRVTKRGTLPIKDKSVSLGIQSKCGKMRTRITPNTDTFYAVCNLQICGEMEIKNEY